MTKNVYDSVMIDVETFGTGPNGALIQIGAVVFDMETGMMCPDSFSVDIDLTTSLMFGGKVDEDTIDWWKEQGGPNIEDPREIHEALSMLSDFFDDFPEAVNRVWAQGPSFDIAILDGFYQRTGIKPPWRHNAARDTRTVYDLAYELGWTKPEDLEAITHVGFEDCIRQIKCLLSAYNYLATQRRERCVKRPEEKIFDCPATQVPCKYYSHQEDSFGEVVVEHCCHTGNTDPDEGNCLVTLCPLVKGNKTK